MQYGYANSIGVGMANLQIIILDDYWSISKFEGITSITSIECVVTTQKISLF